MTLKQAVRIVDKVLNQANNDNVLPLFTTEKEIRAITYILNVVEANLDNLSQ